MCFSLRSLFIAVVAAAFISGIWRVPGALRPAYWITLMAGTVGLASLYAAHVGESRNSASSKWLFLVCGGFLLVVAGIWFARFYTGR